MEYRKCHSLNFPKGKLPADLQSTPPRAATSSSFQSTRLLEAVGQTDLEMHKWFPSGHTSKCKSCASQKFTVQAFKTHSSLMNICDLQQTLVSDRGLLNPQFYFIDQNFFNFLQVERTTMAFLAIFLGASRLHLGTRFDGQVSSLFHFPFITRTCTDSTKTALQVSSRHCITTFAHIRCSTLSYMHLSHLPNHLREHS